MKEPSVFKQLDMAMLPIMEHTLVFENEFMLSDNFGTPADMVDTSEFVSPAYPFKVNFTLMLFLVSLPSNLFFARNAKFFKMSLFFIDFTSFF